jgi:hypothetical protein
MFCKKGFIKVLSSRLQKSTSIIIIFLHDVKNILFVAQIKRFSVYRKFVNIVAVGTLIKSDYLGRVHKIATVKWNSVGDCILAILVSGKVSFRFDYASVSEFTLIFIMLID